MPLAKIVQLKRIKRKHYMDAKELLYKAIDHATKVVTKLAPEDFGKSTPDTEWDAKTLVNHMLYELSWVPDMVEGRTIAEVGSAFEGDLIGDDPAGKWLSALELAKDIVKTADLQAIAHLSFDDVTVEDYLRMEAGDQLIHSWDLAAALGLDRTLDPAIAQEIYDATKPNAASLASSGLFKPPLQVPDDADIQTKLLALFGRDAKWKAA